MLKRVLCWSFYLHFTSNFSCISWSVKGITGRSMLFPFVSVVCRFVCSLSKTNPMYNWPAECVFQTILHSTIVSRFMFKKNTPSYAFLCSSYSGKQKCCLDNKMRTVYKFINIYLIMNEIHNLILWIDWFLWCNDFFSCLLS